MTDYFMYYFRKNNLHLLLFFILISNLSLAYANINNQISISQIKLENNQENIVIDLKLSSQLPPKIIELLERGIPIAFNLKIDLIKEDNNVHISFPDSGGHLSTLILDVKILNE